MAYGVKGVSLGFFIVGLGVSGGGLGGDAEEAVEAFVVGGFCIIIVIIGEATLAEGHGGIEVCSACLADVEGVADLTSCRRGGGTVLIEALLGRRLGSGSLNYQWSSRIRSFILRCGRETSILLLYILNNPFTHLHRH